MERSGARKNSGNQLTDKNLNAEAAQDVKDNASKSGLCRPSLTRICTIADVYDALRSHRAYKPSYSPIDVVAIMEKGEGLQFDPHFLGLLIKNIDSIEHLIFYVELLTKTLTATYEGLRTILFLAQEKVFQQV